MHDDFSDLETELKSLRPRAVPPQLLARIERGFLSADAGSTRKAYTSATTWRSWKWAVWSATAAAAAAVIFFRSTPASRPGAAPAIAATAPADIYKPVRADNVLYRTRDEGDVTLADGTPARRVRSQYVDTITWKNPRTNASLSWSVPRDEVRVVPVSFQ